MASYTLHIQYVDRPAETRTFTQAKVTFGRDAGDVVLHDTQVSGRHGEISFDGNTLRYTDVGSTNGSFLLQGQRVANIELTPGIALRLGNSLITVQVIDVPNVAGKGRTVIASPGMAPGFPAPMRPPGAPPMGASSSGAAIPRPGMPAPPVAPPGGFAFAPTAQMQSPVMPAGMPPGPPAGAFVPQHPAPMAAPMSVPQPAPMAPPQPGFAAPPGPPPGTFPGVPQAPVTAPAPAPMAAAPAAMVAAPIAAVAVPQAPPAGSKPDLVNDVKRALLGGWSVLAPTAVLVAGMFAAVMIPISALIWLATLLPTAIAGILAGLLALAQALAMIILVPAAYRYLLGAHLGQPIAPKAAIEEVRAKIADVFVNMLIPGIVLGVFSGPIYWIEGKKLGDSVTRNFQLIGKDVVTIILSWLALAIPIAIVSSLVTWLFFKLLGTLGLLLAGIITNGLSAAALAYGLGLSTWFYFDIRRRFEGGDPEADARVRLAASLPAA